MIEAHGLEKRFGKIRALHGLNLVAQRGQVVAVLGPNGAGKSTFVRAVATLLRLDRGRCASPVTTCAESRTRFGARSGLPASSLRWSPR
jgi:ABC-type multidrug transport system ATPase subunit